MANPTWSKTEQEAHRVGDPRPCRGSPRCRGGPSRCLRVGRWSRSAMGGL